MQIREAEADMERTLMIRAAVVALADWRVAAVAPSEKTLSASARASACARGLASAAPTQMPEA